MKKALLISLVSMVAMVGANVTLAQLSVNAQPDVLCITPQGCSAMVVNGKCVFIGACLPPEQLRDPGTTTTTGACIQAGKIGVYGQDVCCAGLKTEVMQTATIGSVAHISCVASAGTNPPQPPTTIVLPGTVSVKVDQKMTDMGMQQVAVTSQTDTTYEVAAKKEVKLFGFWDVSAHVTATFNAQTGEIVSVKKPWWAFLAVGF